MPFDITNHFMVSLAYKTLNSQLMLGEANYFAEHLNLPEPKPIKITDARVSVNPPLRGGLGSMATTNYFYSFPGSGEPWPTNNAGIKIPFPKRGKLAYLSKKIPFGKYITSFDDMYVALPKLPSLIDTNGAYQLATQWLTAISVDVAALERKHKPLSVQEFHYEPPFTVEEWQDTIGKGKPVPSSHVKIMWPVFNVTWGGTADDSPPVWVRIFGTTKELLHLRMEDTAFSKHPPIVITNAIELNTRPDPVIKKLQPPTNSNRSPK